MEPPLLFRAPAAGADVPPYPLPLCSPPSSGALRPLSRSISAPLARFGSLSLIQRLYIAWNMADTLHWIVTGKDPLMLRFARLTT